MTKKKTPRSGEPLNGLIARVSTHLEQEDIETDEMVIHGIRVDSVIGPVEESDFHPVEIEEK